VKITFEKYTPLWEKAFGHIEKELVKALGFLSPQIEHIGSTSISGLSSKPTIDIMIGLNSAADLDLCPPLLMDNDYVYYENYNLDTPYRRFFVKLKDSPKSLSLPVHIKPHDIIPEELHNHSFR